VNCQHRTKQDPECPYCVVRCLYVALERRDPLAPELTPARELLFRKKDTRKKAERECLVCDGLGMLLAPNSRDLLSCGNCSGKGTL
jgi:hypothetical protein